MANPKECVCEAIHIRLEEIIDDEQDINPSRGYLHQCVNTVSQIVALGHHKRGTVFEDYKQLPTSISNDYHSQFPQSRSLVEPAPPAEYQGWPFHGFLELTRRMTCPNIEDDSRPAKQHKQLLLHVLDGTDDEDVRPVK
ncbi:hypothetical protein BGAL_0288g00070 [Botrytis galanthina]|uniref:Uncharacterized protein n=1 Tax=Botrytis galanthina TaxID=278940 RepID=A0A4V4HU27_9HELO|nr:hypothetical protein BGAL_0288g00070 [Botrytis galanthina]